MGDQRLRARLRRVPAARRPRRRHARAPPHLPRRHRRVHRGLAARRPRLVGGVADRGARASRASARRSSRRPRSRSSPRRSPKAASATSRSAPGARSAASAPWPAYCSAGSSPTPSAGSGSSSSTSRSASLAFVLAPLLLDESRDASVKTFDLPGAVLVTGGLSSLVYAITQAGQDGWLAPRRSASSPCRSALLAGFVGWELRHPEPLMRFGILRTRTVSGANVAGFIMGTAMFSMFLMLTLYMQQVLGYSAMKTGVAYLAVAGTAIVWSARRRPARDARRREAGAGRRDGRADRRPGLLHAGLGRRQLRRPTCCRASCSSGSASGSRSCRSRSRLSRACSPPRPGWPPG